MTSAPELPRRRNWRQGWDGAAATEFAIAMAPAMLAGPKEAGVSAASVKG